MPRPLHCSPCRAVPCQAVPRPAWAGRAMPLAAIATRKQTHGICDRLITALALPRLAMPCPAWPRLAMPLAAIATRINTQRMYHRLITALALPCPAVPGLAMPCLARPRGHKKAAHSIRVREGLGNPPDKMNSSFIPNLIGSDPDMATQ